MDLYPYLQRELQKINPFAKTSDTENKLNQALYTTWYSPFTPITSVTNQTTQLSEGYMDNETVYSIINKIADTASGVPLELQDLDGNVIESHWINDLLLNPNNNDSLKEIIFNYYVYLLSIGNSYIYAPRLARGEASELWTMPSDIVQVVSGTFYDPIMGYRLLEGYQQIMFDKAQKHLFHRADRGNDLMHHH